jgi:hypothetical protein
MTDIRNILLRLGTPSHLTLPAIPMAFFLPGTSDPNAQGVITIVRALQTGLRRRGYPVRVSGVFDRATASAADEISPGWRDRSWLTLLQDVLRTGIMRNTVSLSGFYEAMGATAEDLGQTLTFGQGIRDKENMVPVDAGTRAAFRDAQRQINRLLSVIQQAPVPEDGIIGAGTVKGLGRVEEYLGMSLGSQGGTANVAQRALTIARTLRGEADQLGISATAGKGVSATPASASEPTPPAMTSLEVAALAQPRRAGMHWFLFLAIAGGVALLASSKKGGFAKRFGL